ncbi:lysine histidine transporter 2-like [Gossypium australe]|uniref:Lysine histidine transporter 2-like n=1 Tax=Gossypium australe TaxID=47621 RepID=A0A5B6WPM7_9ROSI|nr:lysine histidine transporter 2-like [Gossypium australe]
MVYEGSESERERAINEWLPVTSNRNAKWWYSAFHNVTAMVGAGVLSLPYAMYHELGQYAFGEKLGLWIIIPQQLTVDVSSDIVYMVTGGQSLKKFHDLVCPNCKEIRQTYFIMIFASVHFVLSHLPNFNSISGVSLAAAVMSLSYSTIAWAASIGKGVQPNVDYSYKSTSNPGKVFDFLAGLGEIAFSYAGHNVVLEIQATMPSTPEKPSKGPMWKGVIVAYLIVAICYLPVAFIGYWAFGNSVNDNILLTLENPTGLIATANIFVVIHVIGSYQIFAMPVFDMMESYMVKELRFRPCLRLRLISRTLYVAFTMVVAICFPFFGGLLSFFGGFAFAPTSYYLPCIIWLIICKPKRFSLTWFINWICIVLGVLLMVLSPIGGLRSIIVSAKDYKFFS